MTSLKVSNNLFLIFDIKPVLPTLGSCGIYSRINKVKTVTIDMELVIHDEKKSITGNICPS